MSAIDKPRRNVKRPLDLTDVDEKFRNRFWSKVAIGAPDECWEWTAYRTPAGYGSFMVRKGMFVPASRASLALAIGRPLLPGEVACHRCDNPPCANPRHIFLGNASINAYDSVSKGRANRAKGEANHSKLTIDQVRAIRAEPKRYGAHAELARRFGVSETSIRRIRTGDLWRDVA